MRVAVATATTPPRQAAPIRRARRPPRTAQPSAALAATIIEAAAAPPQGRLRRRSASAPRPLTRTGRRRPGSHQGSGQPCLQTHQNPIENITKHHSQTPELQSLDRAISYECANPTVASCKNPKVSAMSSLKAETRPKRPEDLPG
jgi:hypothetical protein